MSVYKFKNGSYIETIEANKTKRSKLSEVIYMVDCTNCVRTEQCDLYLESNGKPNRDSCMCKTWRNPDGTLDNNTRRYLDHEELK